MFLIRSQSITSCRTCEYIFRNGKRNFHTHSTWTILLKIFVLFFFVFLVRNKGGPGTMAYTLCQYYPNMKITVCDLQSVVDSARHFRPSLEDCPNQGNISYVVGNFFQGDLPKAELYILSRILHDWSDEKVDLILSNVYECLPSGKKWYPEFFLPCRKLKVLI